MLRCAVTGAFVLGAVASATAQVQQLRVSLGGGAAEEGATGPISDVYVRSEPGLDMFASGRADYGSLKFSASGSAAPAADSRVGTFGMNFGEVSMNDTLTFTTPSYTTGFATALIRFEGDILLQAEASLNSGADGVVGLRTSARSSLFGDQVMELTRISRLRSGWPLGETGDPDGVYAYTFRWESGSPIDLRLALGFSLYVEAEPGSSASSILSFGNTIEWLGISSVTNGSGFALADDAWSLSSASGFDYVAGVPAPGSAAVLLAGAALARRRR